MAIVRNAPVTQSPPTQQADVRRALSDLGHELELLDQTLQSLEAKVSDICNDSPAMMTKDMVSESATGVTAVGRMLDDYRARTASLRTRVEKLVELVEL